MVFSNKSSRCLALAAVGLVCALAGCGSDRPSTVPVEGVVLYNGDPVPNANVTFMPKEGKSASAKTDEQGRFELMTFEPGDGAVVGEHVVTVTPGEADSAPPENVESEGAYDEPTDEEGGIPEKYADPEQSGLRVTVKDGGNDDVKLELSD